MKHLIVWVGVYVVSKELFALSGRGDTWTEHAKRHDHQGIAAITYALWMLIHLITGGRV